MKGLNLGFMKRLMLAVLVGLINVLYHTNVSAYLTYTSKATEAECTSHCAPNVGLWGTGILSAGTIYEFVPGGYASTRCVCVSSAELASMNSCRQQYCSKYVSGPLYDRNVIYNLLEGKCDAGGCLCADGYYKYSSSYCSACRAGYYCRPYYGSSMCAKGQYSASGASTCTACSSGYYASQQGMSSCNPCSGGTFQPSTGQSVCLPCGTNSYTNKQSGATACLPCSSFYPMPSGTTPSPVSALASSLTSTPSGCYIEGETVFTEPSGDKWMWTGDCYYVS